jgi:hypothetical protein
MPINKNLNQAPYFDDYDIEKQFYKVMFKPGFAVQARELTQLQTMLQNQVEQFGDNVFKEGSIVKGCNFTDLDDLEFVKINDGPSGFNPTAYISKTVIEPILGQDVELDYVYEVVGASTGLRATIIQASVGFQTRPPDLHTFYINYLNTGTTATQFQAGEQLTVNLYKFKVGTTTNALAAITDVLSTTDGYATGISVSAGVSTPHVGRSFGIEASPGIVFQKGHFIFAAAQRLIVEKYSKSPDAKSVGYTVTETLVNSLQDATLFDNANGSKNENAPGADRLKLIPTLSVYATSEAKANSDFFTLVRYQTGNAITLRDVSQYNVLGEEMARRTYEESGNYILDKFPLQTDDRDGKVNVLVGTGVAYVKGYRVENSGERSFPIDAIATTETVQNQSVSHDYGNWLKITGFNGRVDIDWTDVTLQNSSSQTLGTAIATNITSDRIYLTAIRMNGSSDINDLDRITDGSGYVSVTSSKLQETSKRAMIFDSGLNSLYATSDTLVPVRAQLAATHSGGVITLAASTNNEDFNCDNSDMLIVDSSSVQWPVLSQNTTLNNSQLNITISASAATNVTVYYNKRLISSSGGVEPYNKVSILPFVKCNYTSSTSTYSLGLPDVYKIVSLVDSAGADYSSSFRLKTNQKDTYYDLSYIEYIEGRPKPADGILTIGMGVFQTTTSSGKPFYSINSYPNSLDEWEIPTYVSASGQTYNLRECFDFRPMIDKDTNASYSALTAGAAGTVTTLVGSNSFTFTTLYDISAGLIKPLIPAVGNATTTDLEYYMSRIDTVVCDSYGDLALIKGEEKRNPRPAEIDPDQVVIANVIIPGYPALSKKQADVLRKSEYAIKPKSAGVKNYTMKDLHSLEKKIDNMAYYISLNQLESDTSNLVIRDENGLSRFKNGFVVDPFNDLTLADISNPQFNASVPFNQKILQPSVKTFPLDLIYESATGSSIFPSTDLAQVATIGRNSNVEILGQPYASGYRNCVSNFYKYVGDGIISPPYDAAYDTTVNPATIDIDLTTPFNDFVDSIQQFLPMTDTTSTTSFEADGRRGAGTETTTTTTRASELVIDNSTTTTEFVGEFVSNFSFEPYMAGRDVKVYMSGLRPNQRHYFYFDGVNVDAHVMPGSITANSVNEVNRYGVKAAIVKTDANGVLRAVFALPPETFFVGDRVLEIADVNTYTSIDSASTSKGFVTYRAYNFNVEKTSLTTATRAPNFDVNTTTTTRNVARRRRGRDPLAQTFFIKKGMGAGSNSVYLSDIDIYFKRKPSTTDGASANAALNGVSVQIREVQNGYPTNQIVPFSVVHKLPADVNVSETASTGTKFTFNAPIRLDVEKEYAVVIQPDASDPNYLVYTSKVGGVDITPGDTLGAAIVQDWGDGVLFTSTNNSAWKSYQDEDIKFSLNRHNFNSSTGSVSLTNNHNEFFTVSNITGRFTAGELCYQVTTNSVAITATTAVGMRTITGTGLHSNYSVGDYIKIVNSAGTDIFKVTNSSTVDTLVVDKPAWFAGAGASTAVVVGDLSFYDLRNPFEMHLEGSSVSPTKLFTVSGSLLLTGLDSGATAQVASIDNINLSYVQPMIMKASDSSSKLTLSGQFVSPAALNSTYTTAMAFNDNNLFAQEGVILYSRSNNPSGSKVFRINVGLTNGSNVTSSPFLDIESSKLIAYQYKITNTAVDTSKYISKTIELAESLDAEDFNLVVTGYRPTGTDIKCYIKPQNAYDNDDFDSLPWIELELFEGVGVYSTVSNVNDYREFKYRVNKVNKVGSVDSGALTYTSNSGIFTGYKRFAVRIDMLSPNIHNAPTLKDYRGIALT